MPNRLANESSPYLLQHAGNPVDWYPWGSEAIERAKTELKPIFLSIGYSACHWCHVMEHESFENPSLAALLNEHFISIKVDREERPDLDQIYMQSVMLMTGRGGWPMSVFLTPDMQPFYGGTYWPPTARGGMPGFDQVITAVAQAWAERREQAIAQAATLTEHVRELAAASATPDELKLEYLWNAGAALERVFDSVYGGFGQAPKFPHPMELRLLLRLWQRKPQEAILRIVTQTLEKMAAGGMYDHLGGGFHRYSVDERWLVPHFEKMLYDNALLTGAYLDAFLATGIERFSQVARETCGYVLREMTAPEGGFYSTQDADSEGEEGKFFVWTPAELVELLGSDAAKTFAYVYDVSELGNFEGHNILNLPKTVAQCAKILKRDERELVQELTTARAQLLVARANRVAPNLDDKVLANWNGLMIDSMAQAAGVLSEPHYLAAAQNSASFVMAHMRRPDGRLLHTWRRGTAKLDAYLDDYACMINALVSLYEASFEEVWIDRAVELSEQLLRLFADERSGGFFYTASDHETLIARQKDLQDNAVPSGNSMAATGLVRLGRLTGRADFLRAAENTLKAAAGSMRRAPVGSGQMLLALDAWLGPMPEIVILGNAKSAATVDVLAALRRRYLPNRVLALRSADDDGAYRSPQLEAAFAGKQAHDEPTVFVCQNFSCQAPVHGRRAALELINSLGK